ncbi:PilZ domain-containing protein [Novosphingobium sp. G106]|uniref:PilZ domain-containing protein n=1 Tax=Novosphingobium sp. G106 TaxID=2849500 RepID=UPI001C2CD53B|nr:PilZ domain-containing protein [Novosphingobium sp. G106]MBV1691208.1 PilZ domain-containing protein [Novosphingobium sp. G106]
MTQAQDASEQPGTPAESGAGFGADMRAAPRSSLMFRTAKLLCETGEYVCVVRDISATGCRLRLFHMAPPDQHLFLELANGDRYAMERVWTRDDHAGFRFSCEIDVDHFIAEPSPYPRRPIRLNLKLPADVVVDGVAAPAVLLDLSQQGARIDAGRKFAIEQKLWLGVEGQPQRFGCVRWRNGYTHGLVLQQGFKLDELAHYALALQPFGADPTVPAPAAAARYG